jgi:sugar/nucleoside kinase (ribokinase family)
MTDSNSHTRKARPLIVAIGSALVDILIHESDQFVAAAGVAKGGMTPVDDIVIRTLLGRTKAQRTVVPGGSACNTAIGCGRLGGPAGFVGKRGDDDMGRLFEQGLQKNNVTPHVLVSSSPTGQVLSVITPDAQRTMFTYLGAAAESAPEEITPQTFAGAALVHVEGYLLFNEELIETALKAAKAAGALVSLDLASFTVVEESREYLEQYVRDYVDILIANEDEARSFTGHTDEQRALAVLAQKADIAVLKVGARGSYIAHKGEVVRVQPMGSGVAVDTTGAGDLWAAGFLYGYVNGYPLARCGELASACGYEVCQVVGANIPDDGWQRIRKLLD